MAILSAEGWQTYTNQTVTGAALASVTAWCVAVSNAILERLKPFHPVPVTLSNVVLDAPPSRDLILPVRPARSITSVYYRADAHGLVSRFTADYLLTNTDNEDYQLLIDDHINSWSRSGVLRRVNQIWGYQWVVHNTRLASTLDVQRGAILVNYLAGPAAIPPEIEAAAVLAVSLLYARKTTGLQTVSESWNGYSASYSGPQTVLGVVESPDIQSFLAPYLSHLRIA